MRPGSSGHPCKIETIQNSLIVMLVGTALSIEAGYCGAGTHPFPPLTKPNGVIRQWQMRTQTLAMDRTASSSGNPPSVRIPILYQVDAFNLSLGRPLFAAKDIRVAVMVVRGELDFWSRPADLRALARDLVNSPKVKTLTIRGGTHYLFLDRPEQGRSQFISEILNFLT